MVRSYRRAEKGYIIFNLENLKEKDYSGDLCTR
jgi:hypothetical protein